MTPCPHVVVHWLQVPSWHVYWKQQGIAGQGEKLGLLARMVVAGQLWHKLLLTVAPRLVMHVHVLERVSTTLPHDGPPHWPTSLQTHEYAIQTGAVHGSVFGEQAGTWVITSRATGTAIGLRAIVSGATACVIGCPATVIGGCGWKLGVPGWNVVWEQSGAAALQGNVQEVVMVPH
jgi:hypothetical protein